MEITQDKVGEVLDNIKNERSYYAGGTLCVDKVLPDGDVLMMSLTEVYFNFSGGGRRLLNIENTKKLYAIYKEHKGETDFYKEQLENSSIKYLI